MARRRVLQALVAAALLLAALSTYFAQGGARRSNTSQASPARPVTESVRGQMIDEQLKTLLAPVGINVSASAETASQNSQHQELELRWKAPDKTSASDALNTEQQQQSAPALTVKSRSSGRGSLPRQRSLELSDDQVLVVAIGAEQELRWWTLMADPRLRRAEMPGPNGELSGQTILLDEADFSVAYPADAAITELRLYHPRWTGASFLLEPIGSTPAR